MAEGNNFNRPFSFDYEDVWNFNVYIIFYYCDIDYCLEIPRSYKKRKRELKNKFMAYKNIPFGKIDAFNVLIEIPQGGQNKYEYDEESDEIKLDFVFWGKCKFPHNYGLIPQTKAGDGDHLDAIVLNPIPLEVGAIVTCRAVGILKTIDRGEIDDKLVVVPVACKEYEKIQSAKDLPNNFEKAYRDFYKLVGIQKNKTIEVKGLASKEEAIEELNKSRL